jgi:UDP-N-acetylglucosamine 2-epimerase (non-hydrolysing)
MDKIFFKELKLPVAKYNLNIGSGNQGDQTGRMLIEIEKILIKENPGVVLVQGDTNSVLAGALATSKLGIKLGHIEAGLRSYDRTMPEETNRIITDQIADYLFTPTKNALENLKTEGVPKEKFFNTGSSKIRSIGIS